MQQAALMIYIAASRHTKITDVTNYITHKIFNTQRRSYCTRLTLYVDEKNNLIGRL